MVLAACPAGSDSTSPPVSSQSQAPSAQAGVVPVSPIPFTWLFKTCKQHKSKLHIASKLQGILRVLCSELSLMYCLLENDWIKRLVQRSTNYLKRHLSQSMTASLQTLFGYGNLNTGDYDFVQGISNVTCIAYQLQGERHINLPMKLCSTWIGLPQGLSAYLV